MTRLVWDHLNSTVPPRFSLQRSNVRGEGVCYSIMGMAGADEAAYEAMDPDEMPGAWYGPGALQKAKAACQRIADAVDAAAPPAQ